MSVKDILARAAAKGLLDSTVVQKSKEDKKKQKVKQRRCNITGSGIDRKIAEFLHHQNVSSIKAEVPVSKAVSNVQQKNVNRTNSYVQLKKSINPISDTALPKVLKHTSHLSSMGKAYDRQTLARKPRTERKRVVLKPVEIVLPPVITPYLSSQGNKPRVSSARHCFHGWTEAKGSSGRILPPTVSKVVKPAVLSRPQPWLQESSNFALPLYRR